MEEVIDRHNLPSHVAIIMDGNGRWASKKGAARIFGHQSAIEAVRAATEGCAELEIKYLTLYAFSTENWARPKAEVDGLMSLLVRTINSELSTLMKNDVRLNTIGDISLLPSGAQKKLEEGKQLTASNNGLELILALNYSGRWEIMQAAKKMAKAIKADDLTVDDITPDEFATYLETKGVPDPELLIRTSGEMRISNFMLWQMAYTELYFTHVLWPDFRKPDLHAAIKEYQRRERRFGKISEQINS